MEEVRGDDMDDDLLFDLAVECESLLDTLLLQVVGGHGDESLTNVITEYQQRFAIWTSHLGVFATRSQSLDRRLRYHGDVKDVVARLLDMMRRSLRQALRRDDQHDGDGDKIDHKRALETLERALNELSSLGVTIRRSSRARTDEKIKKISLMTDLEPFRAISSAAIDSLYPCASKPLRDYLKQTMIYRFSTMVFEKDRREKLKARRLQKPADRLSPIPELDTRNEMDLDHKFLAPPNQSTTGVPVPEDGTPPLPVSRTPASLYTTSQSGLSTLDINPVRQWLNLRSNPVQQPPPAPSSQQRKGTSSAHVGQRSYPPLPTEGAANIGVCEWCGEEVDRRLMRDADWRRHMDRDLRPYVCMAGECQQDHPVYPTFGDWFVHMARHHNRRWYRKVYPSFDWICLFCEDTQSLFASPADLHLHLTTNHGSHLSEERLKDISEECRIQRQRPERECLLCGLVVEEPKTTGTATVPKRAKPHLREGTPKTPRRSLTMTHPDPHARKESSSSDSDSSNHSTDMANVQNDPNDDKTMARHIADHLQGLMLLTLRFEQLQRDQDTNAEEDGGDSDSVDIGDSTDSETAPQAGSQGDEDQRDSPADSDDIDISDPAGESVLSDQTPVPDAIMALPDVKGDYSPETDQFLQTLIQSGAYQDHLQPQGPQQPADEEARKATSESIDDVLSSFMFQLDLWDWDQSDEFLAVGIDLGNVFTKVSWAYSRTPNDIHQIDKWPGAFQRGLGFRGVQGVPTLLSLRPEKRWGYQTQPWATTEDHPIRWLKVLLEDTQVEEMTQSHNSHILGLTLKEMATLNLTPAQIVALYLQSLWAHILRTLSGVLDGGLRPAGLRVAFTVPRWWPQATVKRLHDAARDAGISAEVKLFFIPEPDAASAFIAQDLQRQQGIPILQPGEAFVLCDMGGVTIVSTYPSKLKRNPTAQAMKELPDVLLTLHTNLAIAQETASCTIDSFGPLSIEWHEEAMGSYGNYGEYSVDSELIRWLHQSESTRSGFPAMDKDMFIGKDEWTDLKQTFTGVELAHYSLGTIPPKYSRGLFTGRDVVADTTKSDSIRLFFDSTLQNTLSMLSGQRTNVQRITGKPPKAYVLLGGLSQSPYLRRMLKERLGNSVIPAPRPWTALADGAVLRVLQTYRRRDS